VRNRAAEALDEWFSSADVRERAFWDDYMAAFENTIRATATKLAP